MVKWNLSYLKSSKAKDEIKKYVKDYYRTKPLEVLTIENGIIIPQKDADRKLYPNTWMGLGGVVDKSGDFIRMSGIKSLFSDDLVFGGKYDYREPVEESDETVIFMGAFQPQWGHFLIEYCTRLWYSLKNDNRYKIAYCGFACEKGEIQKPFQDFLRLLGIEKQQLIDVRRPTRFRKIIIPEQSFLRNQYYTKEYKDIIDTAYINICKDNLVPCEKIYFSRCLFIENGNPERERGEWEIQETFRKNGYKILFPEKLSVEEQIFYVRNCKEFAAIPSSTSDNAVFAAEATKRIYIRKAFSAVCETFQIEQMTKAAEVVFIDCYYKPYKMFPLGYGGGPHFIGATREFFSYLNDNKMEQLPIMSYNMALFKTWYWLSVLLLKRAYKIRKDKVVYFRIKCIIDRLLKKNNKKFILYPYGHIGNIVKEILDKRENITYLLADRYKCINDKKIYDIDILYDADYLDYQILLCSDVKSKYHEDIKKTVYEIVSKKERVTEFF